MALFAALNGVSLKFGDGGVRAGVKRADKVITNYESKITENPSNINISII